MAQEKTAQNNPETQKPEVKTPETPETPEQVTQPQEKQVLEAKEQKQPKEKPVDPSKYNRFVDLKFIKLEGGQLREDYEKELTELEKELKACSGKKAAKNRTASIGMNVIKFVEGIPVPKSVFDLVPEKDRGFYFAK